MSGNPSIKDPYAGYRFKVMFDKTEVGAVSEVTGIKSKTDFDRIRSGGNNTHEHALIKPQTYPEPLTLKRMFFHNSDDFYGMVAGVHSSSNSKSVRIPVVILHLLNPDGSDSNANYTFSNCVAVEFEGPSFNAKGGEVSVESIKLWYDYFEFKKS